MNPIVPVPPLALSRGELAAVESETIARAAFPPFFRIALSARQGNGSPNQASMILSPRLTPPACPSTFGRGRSATGLTALEKGISIRSATSMYD